MDNTRFKFLFQRYLHQECNDDERNEFFQLIASSRHDKEIQSLMDTLWQDQNDKKLSNEKADEIFRAILSEKPVIPLHESPSISTRKTDKKTIYSFRGWSKLAAAVTVLFLISFSAFYLYKTERPSQQHPQLITNRVEVTADEHQFVKLPDGSTVVLNSGSTLDYSGSFNGQATREVILSGEGYFDIRHDPQKPFIVHTGKLKTTVLGTAFNIKAYANDNDITVTVTRGKVKVSDAEKEIGIINPDQQITFNGKNNTAEQTDVNSKHAIAWAENDIFFNELTVGEAVRQLEDRFNVNIKFEDAKLKECRFTATFVQNESLEQILAVICEFNNVSYREVEDNIILISGDGC